MDVCAVCLESIGASSDVARVPGCGHALHVACLINCAQYDPRCPVCRGVGEGVHVRDETTSSSVVLVVHTPAERPLYDRPSTSEDDQARAWRNYAARRRRLLRTRPLLRERVDRLKTLRREMSATFTRTQRAYDARCREVWRSDPEVTSHRAAMTKLQRKHAYLERQILTELQSLLGPQP